jgi:hypothetical protein
VATSTLVGVRLKHTQNTNDDTQNINSECTLKQIIPLSLFLVPDQLERFLKKNKFRASFL